MDRGNAICNTAMKPRMRRWHIAMRLDPLTPPRQSTFPQTHATQPAERPDWEYQFRSVGQSQYIPLTRSGNKKNRPRRLSTDNVCTHRKVEPRIVRTGT